MPSTFANDAGKEPKTHIEIKNELEVIEEDEAEIRVKTDEEKAIELELKVK